MKRLLIILGLSVTFFSCSKDDDNSNPGTPQNTDPTETNTLTFDHLSDTEFLLWIGGEEINTSGMNVADFYVDPIYFVNMETVALIFDTDSVEVVSGDPWNNNHLRLAYEISNDSLIGNRTIYLQNGEPLRQEIFLGMGSRYALNFEQCYLFKSLSFFGSENFRSGESYFGFQTFESVGSPFQISTPADMSPTDTIMIYNHRSLFN